MCKNEKKKKKKTRIKSTQTSGMNIRNSKKNVLNDFHLIKKIGM